MTGIKQAGGRFEVWLDGRCVGNVATYGQAYERLLDIGARYGLDRKALAAKVQATNEALQRDALRLETQAQPAPLPAEPQTVEPVTVTERQAERHKQPCAWYRSIRRFYAIAGERGLDTKAEERIRGALSALLGRSIGSRSELSGGEWEFAGDALQARALCW